MSQPGNIDSLRATRTFFLVENNDQNSVAQFSVTRSALLTAVDYESILMGGSWSKNSWFQGNSTSTINNDQSSGGTRFQHKVKVDLKDLRKPQFVFTRKGYCSVFLEHQLLVSNVFFCYCFFRSMFFDEDGDLAHEFYEEIRTQNSQVTYMKKRDCNLRPQVVLKKKNLVYNT